MVLPENLKKGLSRAGNTIAFARWVNTRFLASMGFLYDCLYASTKLGMTEEAFSRRASKFISTRYLGIFSSTNPSLWWSSALSEIVFRKAAKRFPQDDSTNLQNLAKRVFKLRPAEVAKCIVCGEAYPDTVGLDKDDARIRRPVHFRCSAPDPTKLRALFFEEVRQFVT